MALTRCECCDGRRTIVGLGGMKRDCDNCHGVGHVKVDVESVVKPVAADVVVKVKRKYTKPVKANVQLTEGV